MAELESTFESMETEQMRAIRARRESTGPAPASPRRGVPPPWTAVAGRSSPRRDVPTTRGPGRAGAADALAAVRALRRRRGPSDARTPILSDGDGIDAASYLLPTLPGYAGGDWLSSSRAFDAADAGTQATILARERLCASSRRTALDSGSAAGLLSAGVSTVARETFAASDRLVHAAEALGAAAPSSVVAGGDVKGGEWGGEWGVEWGVGRFPVRGDSAASRPFFRALVGEPRDPQRAALLEAGGAPSAAQQHAASLGRAWDRARAAVVARVSPRAQGPQPSVDLGPGLRAERRPGTSPCAPPWLRAADTLAFGDEAASWDVSGAAPRFAAPPRFSAPIARFGLARASETAGSGRQEMLQAAADAAGMMRSSTSYLTSRIDGLTRLNAQLNAVIEDQKRTIADARERQRAAESSACAAAELARRLQQANAALQRQARSAAMESQCAQELAATARRAARLAYRG
jgi:hypothetical protein